MTNHPFQVHDLFQIKRVANAEVSPDGGRIVFEIAQHDVEHNTVNTQLWMVSSTGGQVTQWTTQGSKNRSARWSPSGLWLAFESNRSGTTQIWVMPTDGGEPRQVTQFSSGATKPVWGRDDRYLWVTSQQTFGDRSPNHIATRLMFRHWDSWCDKTVNRVFRIDLDSGESAAETPDDINCPPVGMEGELDYAVSPNGGDFIYVCNSEKQAALSPNNTLYRKKTDGVHERIGNNNACETDPRYSATGRYLSWLAMERPGYESDRRQIMVFDTITNETFSLTPDIDIPIVRYLWSRHTDTVYFDALERGRRSVYRVGTDRQPPSIIYAGQTLTLYGEIDAGTLLVGKDSFATPLELCRLNIPTRELSQITFTNQSLCASVQWAMADDVWFEGADGDSVHGFLLRPTRSGDEYKRPLIVWIHGGPQSAFCDQFHYRWNPQIFAGAGFAVLLLNPRGSTSYGQRFTDQIQGDWGGRVLQDILAGLDSVLTRYDDLDSDRIAAAGGSFGGYMVNWLQGHSDRFKTMICHAGIFNLWNLYYGTEELWFPEWEFGGAAHDNPEIYDRLSPCRHVGNWNTPMLILHGELDYRVPVIEGIGAFTALQRREIDSRLVIFPDEGHWIMRPQNAEQWYQECLAWLKQHL